MALTDQPRRAFIVKMFSGPTIRLQLREVGSIMGTGQVVESRGIGPDEAFDVGQLRIWALRRGYVVEETVRVEDWRNAVLWPARRYSQNGRCGGQKKTAIAR